MVEQYLKDFAEFLGVATDSPDILEFLKSKGNILEQFVEFIVGNVKDDNEPINSNWVYYESLNEFAASVRKKKDKYTAIQEIMADFELTEQESLLKIKELLND